MDNSWASRGGAGAGVAGAGDHDRGLAVGRSGLL